MDILDSQVKKNGIFGRIKSKVGDVAKKTQKLAQDDPRRIVHSIKVGLALTLVSLFYYFRPLYDGFGPAAMWAVLTVVVVFEFSVGGTFYKCFNRGIATLLAGALGVGAEFLADLGGKKGEPIILGVVVFILAAVSTFMRFFPHIKKRYDYGVTIFILTFSLVAVSGYRVEQIVELAHQRLSTILIGVATCMIISVFLCPVWAGEDLHNLIISNLEKLATFLQGIGSESFPGDQEISTENGGIIQEVKSGSSNSSNDVKKTFLAGYKTVLNTKASEESLANLAWWEPCHGRFRFCHPWKQYLKVGVAIRQCAYHMEALSICIKPHHPQETSSSEIQDIIGKPCKKMSREAGKALNEMAMSMRKMTKPSSAMETHVQSFKSATEELKTALGNAPLHKAAGSMQILQLITMTSVLMEIIKCVENISESVRELSNQARFFNDTDTTSPDPTTNNNNNNNNNSTAQKSQSPSPPPLHHHILHRGVVNPVTDGDGDSDYVVIDLSGNSTCTSSHENQVSRESQHVGPT